MNKKKQLIELYSKNSKHSNYQVLPKRLREIIEDNEIKVRTRLENERLKYILEKIDVRDKSILDIGGNTGFFSFELLDAGARDVHYYEGNKEHAEFVRLASNVLKISDKIKITDQYLSFDEDLKRKYDIIMLLNVLHHIGDDYGDKTISVEKARESIIKQLNRLKNSASTLVFQLGFNWQGDVKRGLFENGTKKEMIDFIKDGIKDVWDILSIGVAEVIKDGIEYFDLNDRNIVRNNKLGEFLNRPLFILKSKSNI